MACWILIGQLFPSGFVIGGKQKFRLFLSWKLAGGRLVMENGLAMKFGPVLHTEIFVKTLLKKVKYTIEKYYRPTINRSLQGFIQSEAREISPF
jgi:hypothetical protein